jgi:hypothetical protein
VIVRSAAAARLCGVSRVTLWHWTKDDVRIRACMFRRGWYRVEALAALGLCAAPAPAPVADRARFA